MSFSSLGLSEPLVRAVTERHYLAPTPIQQAAIPAILRGGDVWASAQTGSGKTAAFALPILHAISLSQRITPRTVQALILVPTRELAAQIAESFEAYATHLPGQLRINVVYGGVSINPQMMALRGGADIVVATPGRLLDLVEKNALKLSGVTTLVLDEADRLFSLGFTEELTRILALLPKVRQNLLFSATFPAAVNALAEKLLRDPARISAPSTPATAPDIAQRAIEVDTEARTQLLRHLIEHHRWPRVLVFVATKYSADLVADKLRRAKIPAASLHGDLSQGARTASLEDFKDSRIQVLVATDVAARGIDIAQLPAVVNYDLPRSPLDYLHRIGRTGRAGESGVAVSFVTPDTHAHFRVIEKRHRLAIVREQIAGFEPHPVDATLPIGVGGVKGHRKSKKDKLREAAARAQNLDTPSAAPAPDRSIDAPSFRRMRMNTGRRFR